MQIEILPNCTGCGLCETINSDVFKVPSNGKAQVNNWNIVGNESDCYAAAHQCPVNAIKIM